MRHSLSAPICTLSLLLASATTVLAVPPLILSRHTNVEWSQVMDDRFDGKLVYDKHYDPNGSFEFISRWAAQGIQATYRESWSELVGYRPVWRSKWITEKGKRREVRYREEEPIYRRVSRDRTPKQIKFSIHNQIYIYDSGAVAPDLASALATAPTENMTIRLVWPDDSSSDMEIGKGTVAAWRQVFASSQQSAVGGQ
jgi:hypothetical protein